MIQIFTGDDRIRAGQEIMRDLGENHETIEGPDLDPRDMPTIFLGTTLFDETRNILIRDLSANKSAWDKLPDYLNTPHNIIIQELKLDKRSATYKEIKSKISIKEFKLPPTVNFNQVYNIYNTAKRDGKRAIKTLEEIKPNEDPIMFFGLLVSQAIKDYASHQGITEKKALKELSRIDLQMKSTPTDPWLLIEAFLIRLASL